MRAYLLVLILTVIATIFFWEEWQSAATQAPEKKQQGIQPDYQAENLDIKYFNQQGQLSAQMQAKNLAHFESQAATEFERVDYQYFGQDNHWQVTAQHSQLKQNRYLQLHDTIVLQALSNAQPIYQINTQAIDIDLINQEIHNDTQVKLASSQLQLAGKTLYGNLRSKQFEIQHDIKATYSPSH
ncbi:LPS export ABC transporter periplasmic protein LptC [Saccharobesus litoralis]|uniref:Lipopolysaccharide export system protein LptC n=1 Tax=Saccharobesus litoralis TaxID=2172099 RepID=A0A2S0VWQ3_9ALTE|nr:LPS export ABC transporter periplasmic protein LptC [Saccharobesus litoralis]AWB68648.1 LPS export ABC transporter periplasmic protein LptC [Saccharobesus litoralis]